VTKVEVYPVGKEQHKEADNQFKKTAENNKIFLRKIADSLEQGKQLDRLQVDFAAAALRHVADTLTTKRPRPNRPPHKVPGDAAMLLALHVVTKRCKSKQAAMEELAELWGIDDISTIEKAARKQGYAKIKKAMEAMVQNRK